MIGIYQNNELITKIPEILEWHCKGVSELFEKSVHKAKFTAIDNELKLIGLSLDALLHADYETLMSMKCRADIAKIALTTDYLTKSKKKCNIFITQYENYRKRFDKELISKLRLSVCPYCNRNFINNGKDRAMAQFDHFFGKVEYPLFALSFFNLIPCCYSCNHTKSDDPVKVSPYDSSKRTDKLLTFELIPVTQTQYESRIVSQNTEFNENIRVLQLETQYKIHRDLILQLVYKAKKYPKSYFDTREIKALGMTPEELYYDNYLSEEHYYKRPLSKLTHDIVTEIKNSIF